MLLYVHGQNQKSFNEDAILFVLHVHLLYVQESCMHMFFGALMSAYMSEAKD